MFASEDRRRARYLARLRRVVAGRNVVLTGASSGIGRAFAVQAGEAGAKLALIARRHDELLRVREQIEALGGMAQIFAANLGDPEQVAKLVSDLRHLGGADVLIHNAAISFRRPVEHSLDRAADFARAIQVNYLGPVSLTLGLYPELARRRGHLVSVSTIGVQTGAPNFSAYVASKAAVEHFMRAFALELRRGSLTLSSVYLPLVRTPMLEPTGIYAGWPALRVDEAARRIGEAVIRRPARIAPRWTTGVELLHTLAPGLMRGVFSVLHDRVHAWMDRRAR